MTPRFRLALRAPLGVGILDVALEDEGAPIALLGPNGSGKTTLLRLIAGALAPTEGEIEVAGHTLFSSARGIDLPCEARGIGYVPQGYGLFPHLRAIDNVAFGLSMGVRKQEKGARRRAALAMLEALESGHLSQRLPQELSGGEQQRVALARALLVDPAMLLLDEPLAALDAGKRRRVRTFLADRLRALERPTLLVTHDVRDALAVGARLHVLEAGRIIQRGTVDELRARPASEYVAELLQ